MTNCGDPTVTHFIGDVSIDPNPLVAGAFFLNRGNVKYTITPMVGTKWMFTY